MKLLLDEEKLAFLLWCPSGLTSWYIWLLLSVCETGIAAEFLKFPFLVLFCAQILSFYE